MVYEQPFAYDWNGMLVKAEFYEGAMDVTGVHPGYEGIEYVPEARTAAFVWPAVAGPSAGWWVWEQQFDEYATPVSPGALNREGADG